MIMCRAVTGEDKTAVEVFDGTIQAHAAAFPDSEAYSTARGMLANALLRGVLNMLVNSGSIDTERAERLRPLIGQHSKTLGLFNATANTVSD